LILNGITSEELNTKYDYSGTNMNFMFHMCTSLKSIPLFDTSNVKSMCHMFDGCTSLKSIPLFDTSNVTDMNGMFNSCESLEIVPLLCTSNVTNMSCMFCGCTSLKHVPSFNTRFVNNMTSMFERCSSLHDIKITAEHAWDMDYMFKKCRNLQSVDLLDTSKCVDFFRTFNGCENLTRVTGLIGNGSNKVSSMFDGCVKLECINPYDFPDYDFTTLENKWIKDNYPELFI